MLLFRAIMPSASAPSYIPLCRLVGTNLIIPHIVGNSGVLRNFSAYFAQLLDVQDQTDLQVTYPPV